MLSLCSYAMLALAVLHCSTGLAQVQVPAAHPQGDAQPKRVEGTVVNSATGEPIRRALVTLFGTTQRAMLTDDDGRFAFDNVRPGVLTILARKPGFFTKNERGTVIDPGSSTVELRLIPTSVVFGQIIGENDEPVEGVRVSLLRWSVGEGRRSWTSAASETSDADGRFRIANLAPGTYRISAGPVFGYQRSNTGYARTYYANAPDRRSATSFELANGEQQEANFNLRPVRVCKVAGMVAGRPKTQDGGANVRLSLSDSSNETMSALRLDNATGIFEAMLPAGSYVIDAAAWDEKGDALSARSVVQVSKDTDGLILNLRPALSIPVNVHREYAKSPADVQTEAGGLRDVFLRLFSATEGSVEGVALRQGFPPEGALAFRSVEPGTYEVDVAPDGPGVYVASARSAGTDLLREPLTIRSTDDADSIEVVLRDDGATVEGSVRGTQAVVFLVIASDTERKRVLMNHAAGGEFSVSGLAPGAYTVYAFDDEDVEYRNPEVLRQFDSKAGHINLSANQKTRITLDVIETSK